MKEQFCMEMPFTVWGIRPVAFHPYTSSVRERIFSLEADSPEATRAYKDFESDLINRFLAAGIRAYSDNKIAFELEAYGRRVFVGFYDWRLSIGFACYDDNSRFGPNAKSDRDLSIRPAGYHWDDDGNIVPDDPTNPLTPVKLPYKRP